MRSGTGFVGFFGIGDEPLGSRNLACTGKAVSARFRSPRTKDTAGTLIEKRERGLGSRSATRYQVTYKQQYGSFHMFSAN